MKVLSLKETISKKVNDFRHKAFVEKAALSPAARRDTLPQKRKLVPFLFCSVSTERRYDSSISAVCKTKSNKYSVHEKVLFGKCGRLEMLEVLKQ